MLAGTEAVGSTSLLATISTTMTITMILRRLRSPLATVVRRAKPQVSSSLVINHVSFLIGGGGAPELFTKSKKFTPGKERMLELIVRLADTLNSVRRIERLETTLL